MGNCAVTKLKGVVNNDNLEFFGSIDISIVSAFTGTERLLIEGDNINIKALNGTFDIYNGDTGLTEYTYTGSASIQPRTQGMKILILDKYSINSTLSLQGIDNGGLKVKLNYSSLRNLSGIYIANMSGVGTLDLSNFAENSPIIIITDKSLTLGKLYLPSDKVYSGISYISWLNGSDVELSLTSLYECTSLSVISLGGYLNVTGELKDLLDELHNNGKVSGNLVIRLSGTGCTFKGNIITADWMSFTFTSTGWHYTIL